MSRSPDLGRPQPDPHSANCIIPCPADPGATLDIVDDANHLLPVTHADLLRACLLRQLAD